MTADRPQQRAFTMVEVLVGLVLTAIVMTMLFAGVLDLFHSSDRTTQRVKAQRASVKAFERLTEDLRAARAPQRIPGEYGSPDRLRIMIRNPALAVSRDGIPLLVSDLVVGRPDQLRFHAEVVPDRAGDECVEWRIVAGGALERIVRPASGTCATSNQQPLQRIQVMPPPAAAADLGAPRPFSFRTLRNPDPAVTRPTCVAGHATDLGTDLRRLNEVVAVDMDLRAFVVGRGGRGEQQLSGSISLIARQAYEYRYALGCAA